jgi:hypothetical protein
LFQSGAPSQMDLFDYKPQLEEVPGAGAAGVDPAGAAADDDDVGAEGVSGGAVAVQVQKYGRAGSS